MRNIYEDPRWIESRRELRDRDIAQLVAEDAIEGVSDYGTNGLQRIKESIKKDADCAKLGGVVHSLAQRVVFIEGVIATVTSLPDIRNGVLREIDHYLSLPQPEQQMYMRRFRK